MRLWKEMVRVVGKWREWGLSFPIRELGLPIGGIVAVRVGGKSGRFRHEFVFVEEPENRWHGTIPTTSTGPVSRVRVEMNDYDMLY
jgi:hypothetical protein